jgi:hypothetical protein
MLVLDSSSIALRARLTTSKRLAGLMHARPKEAHVKVELGRIVGFCLAISLPPVLSSSCATGEEDPSFTTDAGRNDSSAGTGFLGTGGDPSGGVGGSGGDPSGGVGGVIPPGGSGGTDPGGSGGTDPGGSGGQIGAAGTGTNGSSGSGGASGAGSSCNPAFCPNTGSGTPCCIPGLDTCGMDNGMGCVKTD